ncbi:MAG: 50S ribosome-binding GTPase [Candidatus Aenigmarchaeota archaeon]|nr:50S ribosome-binding GTPase [Candidatus Aenigmarchaeota archaeon]MCX8179166.1 50S ribosome-binding GTPase [Candidatus Aenigmarchaeota archaeon]
MSKFSRVIKHYWGIIKRVIDEVDVVLEVCDARMPKISRNRKVEEMVWKSGKKLVLVFNKTDLCDYKSRKNGEKNSVWVSCKNRMGLGRLRKILNEIKGDKSQIKIGVLGYPNTGKSSLINSLVGRKKALTSPVAGFTKGVQWVSDGRGLFFYDTPGVIPFDEKDEVKKALIGAVSPQDIKDIEKVAEKIVEMFLKRRKCKLENFYKISINQETPQEILEMIGRKINYLSKGGLVDINRVCVRVVDDWQRGRLKF